jgi:hypothetical protein
MVNKMKKIILLLLLFGFTGCAGDVDKFKCYKICAKVGMRMDSVVIVNKSYIIKCTCKTWYEHEDD